MSLTGLGWLARLGRRFAGHGPWRRIRWTGLAVGSAVLAVGCVAATMWSHYDRLRQDQDDALRPVVTQDRASATLLYSYDGFVSLGDYQCLVVSLWPLRPDAPLPPGVTAWPRPGEAVLSPATLSSLGSGRADLFGRVSDTIAPSGLESPGERRVYIRPTRTAFEASAMTPATGFGVTDVYGAYSGLPSLYAVHTRDLLMMLAGTVLVPGLLALILGASLDGEARTRRNRQLEGLGASGAQLAVMDLAEAWIPLTVGTAIAAVGAAVFCSLNITIASLDAQFRAADSRSAWPGLVLAIVASYLVACATVLAVRQTRRRRGSGGSRVVKQDPPFKLATVCVLAGLFTIWIPAQSSSGPIRTLAFVLGTLTFAVTVSSLVAVILAYVGKAVASYGHRVGSPAAILGGRRLQLFPTRASRVMLGVCGGILVLGQIQLWTGQLGQQYRDGIVLRDRIGARLVVSGNTIYGPQLQSYLGTLTDAAPIWTWFGPGMTVVSGPCPAMQALGESCTHPGPAASSTNLLLAALAPGQTGEVDFRVTDTSDMKQLSRHGASLHLISTDGHRLNIDDLQRRAYREVPGGLQLDAVGQGFIDEGRIVKNHANWTVVWGVLGILGITIATGLALVGDILSGARDVAPLVGVTDRRRWLYSLTMWRLALPLAISGALSSAAYLVLATGVEEGETFMTPSPRFALAMTLSTVVAGVLLAVWCAAEIGRYGRSWHPGAE